MRVGDGKVRLIAGGGRIYTDIAARFVGSERDLDDILMSDYNKGIVENIIKSGHEAALEFDYFLFGVEGYSRVCEAQLIRKRMASYMIKSGRVEKDGDREFDVVLPENIADKPIEILGQKYSIETLLKSLKEWYNEGVAEGIPEEELRYLKPQATEFKGIIGMNAHALRDFFRVRCCLNAQYEIRDLANKMLGLCKEAAPDLFKDAGANCVRLGYCPENDRQHPNCSVVTKEKALEILKDNYL